MLVHVRIRAIKTCTWSTSLAFEAVFKDAISAKRSGNRLLERSLRVPGSKEM